MARKLGFKPSFQDQRRANKAAHEYYAAISGKETPPEQAALHEDVRDKVARGPRKPRDAAEEPTEHQEQSALISWWYRYSSTKRLSHRLLVAIPNAQILIGFARNPGAFMGYLTAEGFRKGAPDLVLFLARGVYHGLLIEMKRRTKGVLSDEQREMAQIIGQQGYLCMTCYGFEDARVTVERYLETNKEIT